MLVQDSQRLWSDVSKNGEAYTTRSPLKNRRRRVAVIITYDTVKPEVTFRVHRPLFTGYRGHLRWKYTANIGRLTLIWSMGQMVFGCNYDKTAIQGHQETNDQRTDRSAAVHSSCPVSGDRAEWL